MPERERERPRILQRLEDRREAYQEKGIIYRTAWVIAAVIVVLAGLAMTIFPGPAVIVIPLGLAMLSFEFAWAGWLLDKGVDGGLQVKDKVVEANRRTQVLLGLAVVLGSAAVIWVGIAVMT